MVDASEQAGPQSSPPVKVRKASSPCLREETKEAIKVNETSPTLARHQQNMVQFASLGR